MVDVNPAPRPAPALSATSDMPQLAPPPKPAEATPPPDPAVQTVGEALGKKMPADDVKPAETEAKPAEDESEKPAEAESKPVEPEKPDPVITERALRGEITKYKNRHAAAEQRTAAAEARANEVQTQLTAALESVKKLSEAAATKGAADQVADPRPKRENFDNPDAFDTALEAWTERKVMAAAEAKFKEQQEQQRQEADAKAKKDADDKAARENQAAFETMIGKYQERRAAVIEKYPDFEEVAENQAVPVSVPMAHAMWNAENGPEIAYHLGKNPEIAREISNLVMPGQFFPAGHPEAGRPVPNVTAQFFRIGEIAAQLKAQQRPTASKAPPPIKPIGSQAAAAPKSLDAMSGDEYYEATKNEARHSRRRSGPLGPN